MVRKKLFFILFVADLLLFLFSYFLKNYLKPVAIVVPHHDIVKEKRLEFLKTIAKKRLKTKSIIIISPDHFSPNQYRISYADRTWKLSNGVLGFDKELGSKIIEDLAKENGVVANDHGIFNLLLDIKDVWPEAKIVPLLIGQQVKFDKLDDLIFKINKYCLNDCLLISSVDFSHYLPRALADIHDIESLEALEKLEIKSKGSIEVDSPQSLYILVNYARLKKARAWRLFYHSNSGRIEESRDAETTSHFFGWYQKGFKAQTKRSALTFLVGTELDREKDNRSLGERFFYGIDYFNGQLGEKYQPSGKVVIEPTISDSKIELDGDVLKIFLGGDLAVGGYVNSEETSLVFLPLSKVNSVSYLRRGEEKTAFLKDLFKNLDKGKFLKLDFEEGIVIL
jgi:AmmeMemoRadiSam system protein B